MSSTEHRRRLIIASALLVMTAMLVTHPQPAEAVVPASNGKIAFYSDRSGDIDIWLMDADGSNPVNLSQQPDRADFGPAWAPDGTQLVWFSLSLDTFNWDIFAMDADGTNQRNLTDHWSDNLSPNWSPDGSKILFDSNRSGVSEVWVMDADGTNPVNLTKKWSTDTQGVWSPDGSKIAFCSNRSGQFEVWVMNADGTNPINLTKKPAHEDCSPSWSPNGEVIAFDSPRAGSFDVWTMNANGTNPTRLSTLPNSASTLEVFPRWSPDGSYLVFESGADGVGSDIWRVDAEGGNPVNLTDDPAHDGLPAWQPTPTQYPLAFVNPATGGWWLNRSGETIEHFFYGNPGDIPILGDWDCDGFESPGMYRQSDGFVYLRNSNSTGPADTQFHFGIPGDVPIAGDWNGDGCDTIGVYRNGHVFLSDTLGEDDGWFVAEFDYFFGDPGDKPFTGDFDYDGVDTLGLHRESTGLVYFTNKHETAVADSEFFFGDPDDRLVAGDWTNDGTDTVAVFRPSDRTLYMRFTNNFGVADDTLAFGEPDWIPLSGRFRPVSDTQLILGGPTGDMVVDHAARLAYVSFPDEDLVRVIDLEIQQLVDSYVASKPLGLDLNDDGSLLYIALNDSGSVAVQPVAGGPATVYDVSVELDDPRAWKLVEIEPGVLLVIGNVDSSSSAFVVKLDTNTSIATRVASDENIDNGTTMLHDPVGQAAFISEANHFPNSIYKLDLSDPTAPIVAEDLHGSLDKAFRMALAPDLATIHLGSGQIISTADIALLDTVPGFDNHGWFHTSPFFVGDQLHGFANDILRSYDMTTLAVEDERSTDCTTTLAAAVEPVAFGDGSVILVLTEDSLCFLPGFESP